MSPPRMRAAATTPPMARRSGSVGHRRRLRPIREDDALSKCPAGPHAELRQTLFWFIFLTKPLTRSAIGRLATAQLVGSPGQLSGRLRASTSSLLRFAMLFMGRTGATQHSSFSATSLETCGSGAKGRREGILTLSEFADRSGWRKIPDPARSPTFLASSLTYRSTHESRPYRELFENRREIGSRCCLPFDICARRSCGEQLCASPCRVRAPARSSTRISRPVPSRFHGSKLIRSGFAATAALLWPLDRALGSIDDYSRATYRLQLHACFDFKDAATVAP